MNRAVLALLAVASVVACSQQPRSVSYFAAHLDVAKTIVADCRTGAHRGSECVNAEAGVASAARDARMAEFRKAF